ncbi:MAG TPA: TIGR03936 family radical SAM-associated protein [Planctomycetota bacterium]|nr:TIGR03936 family radical SAM-associated protein [Planctomycetota bacterium]
MNIFPYRVHFSKTGKLRFLSHHDLMRLFERALRRSGLPLRMTEGFNPHPILSFPTALGLGIESLDEILEFELSAWTAPAKIEAALGNQLPEGVKVVRVEAFARKDRSAVEFVEYEARIAAEVNPAGGAKEFLAKPELWIERKSDKGSKKVELRRYVIAIVTEPGRVLIRIRVTDQGTAKPEEVLRAIGVEPGPGVKIKKTYTELGIR